MLKRILTITAVLLAALVAIWLWISYPDTAHYSPEQTSGRVPQLSGARDQVWPTMKVASPVGWQNGARPVAAAGLQVQAFAQGLVHPRWLYRLPNGDILVAETNSPPRHVGGVTGLVMDWLMHSAGADVPSPNRINLLRDTNGDGVADQRSVLVAGLNSPTGMALLGPWLYVADTDALLRFPFTPGQTRITAKPEKVLDLPGGGDHWARNVIAAADGKSLFVSVGSSTNIADAGLDAEKNRAAIWQVYPDTHSFRIWSYGLRNPNGMAIEPHRQALWAVVNERDMIGSDMPPDYLTQVDLGTFFGWPWIYWGGYEDTRVQPARPDLREYVRRPDFGLGAHTAPLGLAFAYDAKLGPNFADGAFIGLHGSWNRKPLAGYKVVFVPFQPNGFPVRDAKPVDVLTGFLDDHGRAHGRPVGVITDATGGLLVADDVGNTIWRVSAKP